MSADFEGSVFNSDAVGLHSADWEVPLFPAMDDMPGVQALACCWCLLSRAREGVLHSDGDFDGEERYRLATETPCSHYTMIRRAYGIEGNCIVDAFTVGLFSACATTRVLREVRKRGPRPVATPEVDVDTAWHSSLLNGACYSVTNAMLALCFPGGAAAMARADVDGTHGACCEGMLYNLFCFLPCSHRTFVRKKFGISGSVKEDILATTLCPHLVACQLMSETEMHMMNDHGILQGEVKEKINSVSRAPQPIADMSAEAGYASGRLPPRSEWPPIAEGVTPRLLKERLAGGDLRLLEATFMAMDRLRKGWITSAEMVHLLTDFVDTPFTEGEAFRLVDYIDFDGDGRVEYVELMRALSELTHFQRALAPTAFDDVDAVSVTNPLGRGVQRRLSLIETVKFSIDQASARRRSMA